MLVYYYMVNDISLILESDGKKLLEKQENMNFCQKRAYLNPVIKEEDNKSETLYNIFFREKEDLKKLVEMNSSQSLDICGENMPYAEFEEKILPKVQKYYALNEDNKFEEIKQD